MCQLERLSFYRYKFWKPQNPMISETFYFRKTCLFLLNFLFAQSPAVLNRRLGSLAYFSLCAAFGFVQASSQALLRFFSQTSLHARSCLAQAGAVHRACGCNGSRPQCGRWQVHLALCPARSKQARAAETSDTEMSL